MANETITLYIDDTSLRLMVIHGKQIKKWAELPLEPGLVKNAVIIEEAKVAANIKQLFKIQKIRRNKVIVGVSGLHCLSRPITLPQLPKEMLTEAVRREAKRVLPVPLEQLYLSWLTIPTPEEKTEVFMVAIPRKTADTLLKVLRQAGLKPSFIDLKPLLLARAVKEATAIIADVQSTEFDIVIMADGVPQPVRTVSLPGEALSWEEKLPMIREELDRTIKFYNSNNEEKPLDSTTPIFVSGELVNEPERCKSLSNELGHPVLPLPSPLECPAGLDTSRYMVNISLALQKPSPGKEAGPSVANIDILPTLYQRKPLSLTRMFALPGAAITIGLIVFLVMLIQSASADNALLHRRLENTNQELSQKQELTENIISLEEKVTEAKVSRDNFTAALGSLEKQSNEVNGNLSVTITSLPGTVSLKSISYANNTLIITGKAPCENGVLSYLAKLSASGEFTEINITNMTRINDEQMNFTLLGNPGNQSTGVSYVEVALNSVPTTISLVNVSYANNTLTINGRTADENELLFYLQDLEASDKFSEVTVTSMSRVEDGGIDFVLVVKGGED